MLSNVSKSLTPQEVAHELKIAKNTVYALIKRGELNSYRIGNKMRIESEEVESYKKRMSSGLDKAYEIPSPASEKVSIQNNTEGSIIICGQDSALDILSKQIETKLGISTLRSYVGSYSGLYALYNGQAHLATAHLYDGDTKTYNKEYVKRMLPGTPFILINFVKRIQGFYVAPGNPKNIKGWDDLQRDDITIANREKGSGTRVLLDERLKKMRILGSSLRGYNQEFDSHLGVASAISRGQADFGLGNELAGKSVKNIDFIPLQQESYDLVIKLEDFQTPLFQNIFNILKSTELKTELDGIGYYDTTQTGKVMYITEEFK